MDKFIGKAFKGDKVVWVVFIFLFCISIVEMFSASSMLVYKTGSIYGPISRHLFMFLLGFVCFLVVQVCNFKVIRFCGYFGLGLSFIFLICLLLGFGVEQAGAARFFRIFGVQFQPSELAKLSLIVVTADQIERFQDAEKQEKNYRWFALVFLTICGLIFLENLSTAALIFVVIMTIMAIGEVRLKRIFSTIAVVFSIVAVILIVAWTIPERTYREYEDVKVLKIFERAYTWVARIENFVLDDDTTENKFKITNENYQENHAQIAIARGGFIPSGPGTSVECNYLPEAFSDFIFAIIVEELGAIVGIAVIILYLVLLYRAGNVAQQCDSLFAAILVIGVTLTIVLQALFHICVSVRIVPVTGQPLPLISNGGTSIIVNCIYFGLIILVTRYIQQQKKQAVQQTTKNESVANNVTELDDTTTESTPELIEEIKEL